MQHHCNISLRFCSVTWIQWLREGPPAGTCGWWAFGSERRECDSFEGSMMAVGPFYCADGHEDLLRAVFQHVGDAEYR